MPIPQLTSSGFLPPGIHDCRLEEIGERFGRFQSTDRRPRLFRRLRRFCEAAGSSPLISALIVDGSFVTAKPDPGDIDLVVVVRPGHDFVAPLRPSDYNLLSKKRVRKNHRFDILLAEEGSEELSQYLAFFQGITDQPDDSKGILRIRP